MYLTRESYFEHYGVPGMRWGHRKSPGSSASPSSKKRRTPSQQAKFDKYMSVGKQVARAVLITGGTIAVASVAGPIVAAGAGAAARAITARNTELYNITKDSLQTTRELTVANYNMERSAAERALIVKNAR